MYGIISNLQNIQGDFLDYPNSFGDSTEKEEVKFSLYRNNLHNHAPTILVNSGLTTGFDRRVRQTGQKIHIPIIGVVRYTGVDAQIAMQEDHPAFGRKTRPIYNNR